ncbi:hypothetical protein [Sphingomonas aurantiaca]|uniref:hypothetical protein n=1 Tax=Sphingomonas aurantiaca TaxID=185949 RepID=UPI003A5BC489
MKRRDALIRVIDALHAEIAALKSNDVASLERATADKLAGIEQVALLGTGPAGPDIREARGRGEPAQRDVPDLYQPDGGKCSPPPANADRRRCRCRLSPWAARGLRLRHVRAPLSLRHPDESQDPE